MDAPSCPVASGNGIRSHHICKRRSQSCIHQARSQPSIQPSILDPHPAAKRQTMAVPSTVNTDIRHGVADNKNPMSWMISDRQQQNPSKAR
ncbi:hypothetical protein ACLOJK_027584 [Asimina triloba]